MVKQWGSIEKDATKQWEASSKPSGWKGEIFYCLSSEKWSCTLTNQQRFLCGVGEINKNLQPHCFRSVTKDAGLPRLTRARQRAALTFLAQEMCFLLLQWVLLTQDPTGVYQERFTDSNTSRHPRDRDWSMGIQEGMPCEVQMEPRKPGSFTLPSFSLLLTEGSLRSPRQGHSYKTWVFCALVHCQEEPLCFDYFMGPMQYFCLCFLRFL